MFRNCKETDDSALNRLLKNYRDLSRKINGCPFAHTIDEAITLMEQWLTVRDHLKFFETIIAAKEEASLLFDKCKSINSFFGDQFESYNQIRQFIDENRDNFSFLTSEQKEAVVALKAINTDEEPWEKMPSYMKLKKNINGQLQEKKHELVEDVKTQYNNAFDELEQYAESVKVEREKFAKRDVTISLKTNTNNFYALQANANSVPTFYEEQWRIIDSAKPGEPTGRKRISVRLSTHSTKPIRSEADIDSYLQTLKEQLMKYISDDNDIIVS